MEKSSLQKIVEGMKQRCIPKQDVFHNTIEVFDRFKAVFKQLAGELRGEAEKLDNRLEVEILKEEDFSIQFKFAGDIIICSMHTNVFNFDTEHDLHKTDYVKKDRTRSYCGMINFHNFLADSYKYNRSNDMGALIARVMVNRENHFFVEGERQLGFLYNDFENAVINDVYIRAVIENVLLFSLEFELLVPPFGDISQVSVEEMKVMTTEAGLKTSKAPGFKFSYMREEPKG